jgi:hypothetical protein
LLKVLNRRNELTTHSQTLNVIFSNRTIKVTSNFITEEGVAAAHGKS